MQKSRSARGRSDPGSGPNAACRKRRAGALALLVATAIVSGSAQTVPSESKARFTYPCEGYVKGLRGTGNFGVRVSGSGTPFSGTWHLAEDVWLPGGTEVRAIADGVVRYSAFSPTWTDAAGQVHWNLGNVIVIEHALEPPEEESTELCSFYVHLAADRRAAVGDRVKCGDVIGRVGAHRSGENGRYPAHLHFGIHRGPYVQIPPSLERELRSAARAVDGLRFGDTLLRGELELKRVGEASVLVTATASGESAVLSLLVGSTAPTDPPPDIMSWCQGYGDRQTVAEWISPSLFLKERVAAK